MPRKRSYNNQMSHLNSSSFLSSSKYFNDIKNINVIEYHSTSFDKLKEIKKT